MLVGDQLRVRFLILASVRIREQLVPMKVDVYLVDKVETYNSITYSFSLSPSLSPHLAPR